MVPSTLAARVVTRLAWVSESFPVPSNSRLVAETIEPAASVIPPAEVVNVTLAPAAVISWPVPSPIVSKPPLVRFTLPTLVAIPLVAVNSVPSAVTEPTVTAFASL